MSCLFQSVTPCTANFPGVRTASDHDCVDIFQRFVVTSGSVPNEMILLKFSFLALRIVYMQSSRGVISCFFYNERASNNHRHP